jgi:hypothetical protein
MDYLTTGQLVMLEDLARHGFHYDSEDGLFHRKANGISSKAAISQIEHLGTKYTLMVIESDDPQAEDGKSKSSFMVPGSPESRQEKGLGCRWPEMVRQAKEDNGRL